MAWALASPRVSRLWLVALVGVIALPLLLLRLAFPSSGPFPFLGIDLALIVAMCAIGYMWLPTTQRTLRAGLVLYGLTAIAVFCIPNPIGGNIIRLTVGFGPAIIVALASLYRRRALLILTVPLLVWQLSPAVGAIVESTQDQTASARAYYQPLISELTRQPELGRVEIPFTRGHWEAAYVAPEIPLARGWERQTDMTDNPLFYDTDMLTPASYEKWLDESGVTWIALPDIDLDYSAQAEARLIEAGPSYLKPVWHNAHWRLWKVVGAPGLATGPARLVSLHPDQLVVEASGPGTTTIRVRYTPAWNIESGPACVGPSKGPWTELISSGPGKIVIGTTLLPHDNDCPTSGSTN
jgi:hypothetical protein